MVWIGFCWIGYTLQHARSSSSPIRPRAWAEQQGSNRCPLLLDITPFNFMLHDSITYKPGLYVYIYIYIGQILALHSIAACFRSFSSNAVVHVHHVHIPFRFGHRTNDGFYHLLFEERAMRFLSNSLPFCEIIFQVRYLIWRYPDSIAGVCIELHDCPENHPNFKLLGWVKQLSLLVCTCTALVMC